MPERFLNLSEAAEILRISEEELDELVKQGKIPAYRIAGEFLRFDKNNIEKYIKSLSATQAPKEEEPYSLSDKLHDLFYYNDFYIFSFLFSVFIILLILHQ